MNLCVIPARGGSKRIPRKNIKMFAGKPMVAYAIQVAQDSGLFGRIIVSTDDPEVAKVSQNYGAEVPFRRPAELAKDQVPTNSVITHAVNTFEKKGIRFNFACCIYPCVPLLRPECLVHGYNLQKSFLTRYVFPVLPFPVPIKFALTKRKNGLIQTFFSQKPPKTSILEHQSYYDAGQFYWGTSKLWRSRRTIHENGIAFEIPRKNAVDINTPQDWDFALRIFLSERKLG